MSDIEIRCSKLDSLFACTPSVLSNGQRVSRANGASDIGKAVHIVGEQYVTTGAYNVAEAVETCGLPSAGLEIVGDLATQLVKTWDGLSPYFQHPSTELEVKSEIISVGGETYQLVGTVDVLSPQGDTNAIFADWKSGFLDDGYYNQMAGYAYSIWCEMGKPPQAEITGIIVFLKHKYSRVIRFNALRLRQWYHDLTHNVLSKVDKYTTGGNCRYCELYNSCPARLESTTWAVSSVLQLTPAKVRELGRQRKKAHMQELLQNLQLTQAAIDDAREALKQEVAYGGEIDLGNGKELAIREVSVERLIPEKAMKVIRSYIEDDATVVECMKISLPQILTAAEKQYGEKDQKRSIREALHRALSQAGAIVATVQQRLEVKDIQLGDKDEPGSSNSSEGDGDHGPGLGTGAVGDEPQLAGGGGHAGEDQQPKLRGGVTAPDRRGRPITKGPGANTNDGRGRSVAPAQDD